MGAANEPHSLPRVYDGHIPHLAVLMKKRLNNKKSTQTTKNLWNASELWG
jgi:hypothetical protein